jgi:hypothetical protein
VQKQNATATRQTKAHAGYALNRDALILRNGKTLISFDIPKQTQVSLKAYNLSGKAIAELAAAEYPAGRHAIEFDSKSWRQKSLSGIFLIRMQADGFVTAHRFFLGNK